MKIKVEGITFDLEELKERAKQAIAFQCLPGMAKANKAEEAALAKTNRDFCTAMVPVLVSIIEKIGGNLLEVDKAIPTYLAETLFAESAGWLGVPDARRGHNWNKFVRHDECVWAVEGGWVRGRLVDDFWKEQHKFDSLEYAIGGNGGVPI